MQTYVIEYSTGPPKHRQEDLDPEAPKAFLELDRRLLAKRIHVFRKLRLGTTGAPFDFLELVEGDPSSIAKYTDVLHEIFGGAMQVRQAYPIEDQGPVAYKAPSRVDLDRVDRAGVGSFPASDPPSWSTSTS